jgi:hypothetical protein
VQSPSDFGRKGAQFGTTGIRVSEFDFPLRVSSTYTCGPRRGATQSDSSQFTHSSGWDEPRRYPDYTERVHVVLSREGDSTSLGLGLTTTSRETVTRVGPDVDCGSQKG